MISLSLRASVFLSCAKRKEQVGLWGSGHGGVLTFWERELFNFYAQKIDDPFQLYLKISTLDLSLVGFVSFVTQL